MRTVLAEIYGFGSRGTEWETLARSKVPNIFLTDCRDLADNLNSDSPARVRSGYTTADRAKLSTSAYLRRRRRAHL